MDIACICGNNEFIETEKQGWRVTPEGKLEPGLLKLGECKRCGIIRQLDVLENYKDYYAKYPPANKDYVAKDWECDKQIANKRIGAYRIKKGSLLLDVGSGSGAFVDSCRQNGIKAYGCELCRYDYSLNDDFIYYQKFEDIHFPTDYFDFVTCHDVLEHSLSPVQMLEEMFRIVNQEGQCIVEIPRFFHESGNTHWKKDEHIWFFTEGQLEDLLGKKIGFDVIGIKHPVEFKSVFYCEKPLQKRVKILVPPGIGDSYWSIVKMESFLKREKLGIPDVTVICNADPKYNGHLRSAPFLQMFPFLHSTGKSVANDPRRKRIWREAYLEKGRTIFRNVLGFDYFLAYNGHLRFGESLEEIDPDLDCDWFPPMFVSLEQMNFEKQCKDKYGKYIVFYFPSYGTFSHWYKQFPLSWLIDSIRRIINSTDYSPIFVGAKWDEEDIIQQQIINSIPNSINLAGKTSLDELFGAIKGSEFVMGYPSGLPIMAAVLKKKTLIIWNDYYDKDFAWNCCPPEIRGKTYFIENTHGLTSNRLVKKALGIINADLVERSVVKPITIACVLKSGGEFTVDHVERLRNMVGRNVTIPYRFVCLSDIDLDICERIPLKDNYPDWWSKIELFRPDLELNAKTAYFDLDTDITGNIDNILIANGFDFALLEPWGLRNERSRIYGSGMMLWKNDGEYSFLYDKFNKDVIKRYRGDQEYISSSLKEHGNFHLLKEVATGIYSYKKHCLSGLPEDAKIVCFHGKPRPWQVNTDWVRENWI